MTWDQLMILHGKQLSQFEYKRTADWLKFKEKPFTREQEVNWNRKWSARYKALVEKHFHQAKDKFEELSRMKDENNKVFDIITAEREAAAYIDITFYENKQEATKTYDQAMQDEIKRNTAPHDESRRREEVENILDEKKNAREKMKENLDRIVAAQRKSKKL